MASSAASRALDDLRANREALERFNGDDGWVREDLPDQESEVWQRLFHEGHQLMARASDAGATNAEIGLAMGLRPRAVASHLASRRKRQKSSRRARLAIERHGRSRLWRSWYELSWRLFWNEARKDTVRRERGEQVPDSPFIEDVWDLSERQGYERPPDD